MNISLFILAKLNSIKTLTFKNTMGHLILYIWTFQQGELEFNRITRRSIPTMGLTKQEQTIYWERRRVFYELTWPPRLELSSHKS